MRIRNVVLSLAAAALLAGTVHAASQADYDKAVADATTAVKAAAAAGNEWRDTGKILKKAAKAAKGGNFDKAVKLARKAEFQGKMAEQQAIEQANAGNPTYLY